MICVTARISDDHSYDEMEEALHDTDYLAYSRGGLLFARIEFPKWHMERDILDVITEDLFNLGLTVDCLSSEVINSGH